MKFNTQEPAIGTTRIRTFFALFPIYIGNTCRWLETITVKEEWEWVGDGFGWKPVAFI